MLELRRSDPAQPTLIPSQYVEPAYVRDLLQANASGVGYLLKDRVGRVERFLAAIEDVAAGGIVLDPEVVNHLMQVSRPAQDPLALLTAREREVLALMAEGDSNAGIAARLHLSLTAVEKYVGRILEKLGLEPSTPENRRVLAVLSYLQATRHEGRPPRDQRGVSYRR